MDTIEIFGLIFILLAAGGLYFIFRNYFTLGGGQLSRKNRPLAHNQMNDIQNKDSKKSKTYLDANELHVSGSTVTESNNNMSNNKFDGTNLNPEHAKPNVIDENSQENKEISKAAHKGEVYDIANESAMNQPQDRRAEQVKSPY